MFSSYYLKSAVVTIDAIATVAITAPDGTTVQSADLTAANQGKYEVIPQSGPTFTITASQFAAYTALHGSNQYIPTVNIVQADQITDVQAIVGGGATTTLLPANAPEIGKWLIKSPQSIVDNATFTSNYAAYTA